MSFITEDFLLHSETARTLYHEHAAGQPIIDYHCHLPPAEIAANRGYRNLAEVWLGGDHYKWRAMRANGIDERFISGNAPPYEKFLAWARTVPLTLRSPLYHWTHLELKRCFGIDELLDERTAERIWDESERQFKGPELRPHGLFERFKVEVVCTTDDPTSTLDDHLAIANSGIATAVLPTFRPDRAHATRDPERWRAWVDELAAVSEVDCGSYDGFLAALEERHTFFHEMGARLSDHGLMRCPAASCDRGQAARIYDRLLRGEALDPVQQEMFSFHVMRFLARLDHEQGWVMQLHLGALRDVNTPLYEAMGPDVGGDTIGDFPQVVPLARFLDALHSEGCLPRTILYNCSPADSHAFATMTGCFQDGSIAGKIQYGAAWWFLDTKGGNESQLNALSDAGLLGRFLGMLTDSRSFFSYCRHEYFRRILCNLLGAEAERGELPLDMELLGGLVENICYRNARDYFTFER